MQLVIFSYYVFKSKDSKIKTYLLEMQNNWKYYVLFSKIIYQY